MGRPALVWPVQPCHVETVIPDVDTGLLYSVRDVADRSAFIRRRFAGSSTTGSSTRCASAGCCVSTV
jgi:hypothetical protein